jgi:hypothetical protein
MQMLTTGQHNALNNLARAYAAATHGWEASDAAQIPEYTDLFAAVLTQHPHAAALATLVLGGYGPTCVGYALAVYSDGDAPLQGWEIPENAQQALAAMVLSEAI